MATALPVLAHEGGLSRYLDEIRKFPMLEPTEEYMLAKRWREHGDREAAHKLVTSHLRLIAKIATATLLALSGYVVAFLRSAARSRRGCSPAPTE